MIQIAEFVSKRVLRCSMSRVLSQDITLAYTEFNGSSVGRNKLHAALKNLPQVSKDKNTYFGIKLIEAVKEEKAVDDQKFMLELEEKKAGRKARIAIEEKKLAMEEKKLAEERIAREARIASEEKRFLQDLAERKADREAKFILEDKKIDATKELEFAKMNHESSENEKKRNFMGQENNKNRLLTMMTSKYNKYLDLEAYGTNSFQFITGESLKKVIGFNLFDKTNSRDFVKEKQISDIVDSHAEDQIAHVGNSEVKIKGIDIDTIFSKVKPDLLEISEVENQIKEIIAAPKDDKVRMKIPVMEQLANNQDPNLHKKKHKTHYLRNVNDAKLEGDKLVINCYTCNDRFELNSSAFHKCHNVPESKGGDWSKDNVYLCCASCNQKMGNSLSVLEFKVELYANISEE